MPRKYPIESVKTVSDLLNIFGARFLERGIVLSEQVEIHPEGDLVYSTTVNGYHVVFDGQRLPGQTSCECMAATKWPYCKHMAALAVLLIGDGELPRLAKQMGTHEGQHALVDELDENELRELIHAILDLSKDAKSILTKRLETKATLLRDWASEDANRLLESISDPSSHRFTQNYRDFVSTITTMQKGGFGDLTAPILVEAAPMLQCHRQRQRDATGPITFQVREVIELLSKVAPPPDLDLLEWIKGIIRRENPERNQEDVYLPWFRKYLTVRQHRELLAWLADQPSSLLNWARRWDLARQFSTMPERIALAALAPQEELAASINFLTEHAQPTPDIVATVMSMIDRASATFDDRIMSRELDYLQVIDWLLESPDDSDEALLDMNQRVEFARTLSIEKFSFYSPWWSLQAATAVGFDRLDIEWQVFSQIDRFVVEDPDPYYIPGLISRNDVPLFLAVAPTFFYEPPQDIATATSLVSYDDAALATPEFSHNMAVNLSQEWPVTAVVIGSANIIETVNQDISFDPDPAVIRNRMRDLEEVLLPEYFIELLTMVGDNARFSDAQLRLLGREGLLRGQAFQEWVELNQGE